MPIESQFRSLGRAFIRYDILFDAPNDVVFSTLASDTLESIVAKIRSGEMSNDESGRVKTDGVQVTWEAKIERLTGSAN